ncbi:MAG: TrbI/VirB10 family protein, partial [Candidatus Omnitrophica bacterium]|nr:TrbI/VirB10 family protein [Candidatus Omnitrophota bacterium]
QSAMDALKNTGQGQGSVVVDPNNQDEKKDFLRSSPEGGDYLSKGLQTPRSRYEIKAGTYIPGALVSGINSDMPGSVKGVVRQNVYDTVSGNYILIPQGTQIIGSYDSKVTFGQNRVLVVWDRLIFPDGSSIDLDRMQGVDISGYAGLNERVNNHYFKMYANALLLSFVGAGYDALNNNSSNNNGQLNAQQQVAANVGQQLSNVASKTLEKNIDVQPTITVSPGHRFNIIVMKDMILKEVKDAEGTLAYSK